MEYKREQIIKEGIQFISIPEFLNKYDRSIKGTKLDANAISYYMREGKIDFMKPARDRFIVLTDSTRKFLKIRKR